MNPFPTKELKKLNRIKPKIGVKSNPPIEGINFLIGSKIASENSFTNRKNKLSLFGDTQLMITDPIIEKNNICTINPTVSYTHLTLPTTYHV